MMGLFGGVIECVGWGSRWPLPMVVFGTVSVASGRMRWVSRRRDVGVGDGGHMEKYG